MKIHDHFEKPITLSDIDVSFIRYHIRKYNKNFRKAKFDHANLDASAIVIFLSGILKEPCY